MITPPWHWQFPPIADLPDLEGQLAKIHEELDEVMEAFRNGEPPERITEELIDLDSATEQALRILKEEQGVNLNTAKRGVIEKNDRRGYYGVSR